MSMYICPDCNRRLDEGLPVGMAFDRGPGRCAGCNTPRLAAVTEQPDQEPRDLVDFLLARFAEDEAAARAAIDPDRPGTHWHWVMDATDTPVADGHLQRAQDDGESVSLRTVEEYPTRNGWSLPHFVVQSGEVHGTGGEHITRWDPARVLAECDAKRRIVELHSPFRVTTANDGLDWNYSGCEACHAPDGWAPADGDWYPCLTLRLLALPYADHPDYLEEWRP